MKADRNIELVRRENSDSGVSAVEKPLAEKLRPLSWDEFSGLENIDTNLLAQLRSGRGKPPSLLLWGPPGSGKTTLARLIGNSFNAQFIQISSVLSGVKDVREVVSKAKEVASASGVETILFVDEIHRFNKAQQDAFLPHVEDGTLILLGATTENPSFYLGGALLSRMKVLVLPALSDTSLDRILVRAAAALGFEIEEGVKSVIFSFSGGDARRLINLLEGFYQTKANIPDFSKKISKGELVSFLKSSKVAFYDRAGEEHYNIASAFIKSLRGSDPSAALYWGFRMLEGGEDPRFIIRRMISFASEDIGNADPRALMLAVSTFEAFERIGLPEGRLPIAQCITYLASAPKSNRSYVALNLALELVKAHPTLPVPLHLRNAPTGLMQSLGYGADYAYPHDFDGGFAPAVQYLPDELKQQVLYEPTERGYEKTIKERLQFLKQQTASKTK